MRRGPLLRHGSRQAIVSSELLGWAEGFEPSATGTTIRRSTKLSYAHREGLFNLIRELRDAAKSSRSPVDDTHASYRIKVRVTAYDAEPMLARERGNPDVITG